MRGISRASADPNNPMHTDLQDVDEDDAAAQRQAERQRQEDDLDPLEDEDEDEFADFLVEDEEGEKSGEPRRRRRALAKALPAGVSAEAFQASDPRLAARACRTPLRHTWRARAAQRHSRHGP